jgi:tetratricopeptide (TPR) repeat protein
MNRLIFFLIGTLFAIDVFANVNFIDISKISSNDNLVNSYNYIKENQNYFDHWTNEWKYEKPKSDYVKILRESFSMFSTITIKNEELFLLLRDIAHYLYNLDDTVYNRLAVNNYNAAIKSNPNDYRAFWFLAYHYAQANVPNGAIENFMRAQDLLPSEQPADFWDDYAWSTAIAGMPSHSIFAMDRARDILGKQGNIESQLGQNIRNMIVPVHNDSTYVSKDIWTATRGDKITFICRPLGIKFLIDSTWNLSIKNYTKHQCFISLEPTTLKNNKGKEIHYSLALLMKVVKDEDKLDDFLNTFVSKYPRNDKVQFSDKYDKMSAFEILDNTIYQEIGGGHLYMIGIERKMPEYSGLLLENPLSLPSGEKDKMTYYTVSGGKNRFKGRIFYLVMLDTCEDIHEESYAVFKKFFDQQMVIE